MLASPGIILYHLILIIQKKDTETRRSAIKIYGSADFYKLRQRVLGLGVTICDV